MLLLGLLACSLFVPPASALQQKVALVSGANKGIGKEIARYLGAEPGWVVVLGCRNEELGKEAANELQATGCNAVFQLVDLTNEESIQSARDYVAQEFGSLDVLVNNAAVCFNDPTLYGKVDFTPFERQAGISVGTNFFGTLKLSQAMMPLLKESPSPRIVNIASAAGRLSILKTPEKLSFFTDEGLCVADLGSAMAQFVSDVENGIHAQNGWPNTCYGMSKLGIIALTRLLSRDEPQIMVNSVDPGYCATDQNSNQGYISATQGAQTPVALALLPDSEFVSGGHFFEGRAIEW